MVLTDVERLKIISQAWGRQKGYCFFPYIDGAASTREDRIKSYHEGEAYQWPQDKERILEFLGKNKNHDVYWCPSLFEYPRRRLEYAMDEHCLWADLDEVDPREIEDYPPSVAWETSPGRYQALWLIAPGYDIQGASWRGGENHRLTTHLGADSGGWDTTQLLRLPEWPNHKPDHVLEHGEAVMGKLLWGPKDHRRYLPDEFGDLPVIETEAPMQDVIEEQVETVNRLEVWSRVRLRVSKEVRELLSAREPSGDRSNKLWQIERDLADAGCTVPEIVAIVRASVWNKYTGRDDELRRLVVEAAKAVQARTPEKTQQLEGERSELPLPTRLSVALKNVKAPRWIVRDIWTEGGCGFIAGQPKSYKSWFAFDLALSVSTGAPFLGCDRFRVERPGKVLMVQEEDSLPTLKSRYDKLWLGKQTDRMESDGNGGLVWVPSTEMIEPDMDILVREGMTISDPIWQGWLDEQLQRAAYRMVILDPLMMISGDIDEFKGADVTNKIFRPLAELSAKYECAICLVHHMKKSGEGTRGGQRMLGSTAYHAWAHDALYVTLERGGVHVERESKDAQLAQFRVTGLSNRTWTPRVGQLQDIFGDGDESKSNSNGASIAYGVDNGQTFKHRSKMGRRSKVLDAFAVMGSGPITTQQIVKWSKTTQNPISSSGVWQQMNRLKEKGAVTKTQAGWMLIG